MAGNWIKMRADLFTHPKVVRMASALQADTLRTVGGLMSTWCLFDAHSEDGQLDGYTPEVLDAHLRWPGFSEAMTAVGWLLNSPNGLSLPRFDTHNGQSAKRRAQDADRKRLVRDKSSSEADVLRTRGEERREDSITTVIEGAAKRGSRLPSDATLPDEWAEFCKAERPDLNPEAVFSKFRDYWVSKPGKAGTKLDWLATWRNWVREERSQKTAPMLNKNAAAFASYTTIIPQEANNGRVIDITPRLD